MVSLELVEVEWIWGLPELKLVLPAGNVDISVVRLLARVGAVQKCWNECVDGVAEHPGFHFLGDSRFLLVVVKPHFVAWPIPE